MTTSPRFEGIDTFGISGPRPGERCDTGDLFRFQGRGTDRDLLLGLAPGRVLFDQLFAYSTIWGFR